MQEYNITKDNVLLGPHTLLCTLETWSQIGWFLPEKLMEVIKQYMPFGSHLCNMVSTYSKHQYQRNMFDLINDMCANQDFILTDTIQEKDSFGCVDVYEIPSRKETSKGEKYKYMLHIQYKDIEMFIWRK